VIVSCKPYKDLSEGEYLVSKVKIEFVKDTAQSAKNQLDYAKKEELQNIIKQKPNKKLFGVFSLATNLYAYGKRKDNWFRRWIMKMGDEPIILDSSKTLNTTNQLRISLIKNGYFLNETKDSTIITDSSKRKATVNYYIKLNQPYVVKDTITWNIRDSKIAKTIVNSSKNSKIEIGKTTMKTL